MSAQSEIQKVPDVVPVKENADAETEVKIVKDSLKRNFTVVRVTSNGEVQDFVGGKFQSKTPAGAARKAANQACKTLFGDADHCSIDIFIKETTKNHASKEYPYRAVRALADKKVPFAGNTGKEVKIDFKYSMNLKSLKKEQAVESVAVLEKTGE
jgi:hypothetical protein